MFLFYRACPFSIFKRPNLVTDIRKNRERYVSAALIIVRAYIESGCPNTGCKPLNSYGDWSRLCRDPITWLGLPDPATSTLTLMNDNPSRLLTGQVIKAIRWKYGDRTFTVKQLVENSAGDLRELLEEIASDDNENINRKKLGWWFKEKTGHAVDKQRINRANKGSPARYQIQSLEISPQAYYRASNGE